MRTVLDPSTSFGNWLKRLRSEHDLTQEGLAELASCSVQTIRFFESGRRRPSVEMAEHLAALLAIPEAERPTFIRLARAAVATELSAATPAPPAAPVPLALAELHRPPTGATLIGREGELNVLRTLLVADQARLVTLLGAGGMGKTQLALATAHTLAATFTHGAAFVPLAPLVSSDQLPGAIAAALGLTLQGARDTQEQVIAYLQAKELLLVLDNAEHLLGAGQGDATRWVRDLLRLSGLRLLVTSRERLRLSGEQVFELGGLALPQPTAAPEQADAVLLFLERARQVDASFVLNAGNQAAISRICRLVDGMPLALELAATWVRMLSCAEIAEELQRSIDFLVLADRDMPQRHHSMRAVLDHSWALLTAEEQQVLAGLSVFRGGWGREAARTVAGATLPVLAALIDKSLVQRTEQANGQARYDLHELTRQYAAQQLAAVAAHERTVQERHATFYAQWVGAEPLSAVGPRQMLVLAQIEQEFDNIRSAWAFALGTGLYALVQQMVQGLGEALFWRSRYHEGITLFQDAAQRLAVAQRQPAPAERTALELAYLACQLELWVASFFIQIGQLPQGAALFEDLLARLEHLAAQGYTILPGKLALLSEYALYLFVTVNNYEKALGLQQAAVQLARQGGNAHTLAKNLVRLSQIYHFTGNYGAAVPLVEEAIAIGQRTGDQFVLIGALERLALIQTYQGRFAAAEEHFRTALAVAEATRQPAKTASVLTNLGVALAFSGRFQASHAAWTRALGLSQAVRDHNYIVHDTILLGFAALHLGHYTAAIAHSQAGIASAEQLGYIRDGALGYGLLGSAYLAQGDLTAAHTTLETAIARYRTISHPDELSWAMAVQLYLLRVQGRSTELAALTAATLATIRSAEGFNAVQTLLPILALRCFDQGRTAQAIELTIAVRQSAFIQQSAWFTQVATAPLQAYLDQLPPATQQAVITAVNRGPQPENRARELVRTVEIDGRG